MKEMYNLPCQEILVCHMDNLPFYIDSNCFTPVTSDQLVSIFRRYIWSENEIVYRNKFYQTDVVPVYCFILSIDEDGDKCICSYNRQLNNHRHERVEWFPGGLVPNVTYKSETIMSSLYDAITYSFAPEGYELEDSMWLPADSKKDSQRVLTSVVDWWSGLSHNMHFGLFKKVDIDQVFMVGLIEGTGRNQSAIYCGGLVILMVLPISKYRIGKFTPIPPKALNRILQNNGSFIPKDELLRLDEVAGIWDTTCPIIYPFLEAIMGIKNPYF